MKFSVLFEDKDPLVWAKFEEKVGLSDSNGSPEPGLLVLNWKMVPLEKALQIVRAIYENEGVLTASLTPEMSPPELPVRLRLVQ